LIRFIKKREIHVEMMLNSLLMLAVVFFCSSRCSSLADRLGIYDYPNSRSLHQHPIPCTGGLAVIAGMLIGGGWVAMSMPALRPVLWALLPGLVPLSLISALDDQYRIPARHRILVHLWAAVTLLVTGFIPGTLALPGLHPFIPGWATVLLTLLFTVWMINLYNFMDGMDGFAGGMAVIGFATLAWLGRADAEFAVICLIVAAASAGFLTQNFPPARIFLGDTGSTSLGFLAAACSLWGSKAELFPLWIALLVFSPFIVDASVTLSRRLLRGEKIWRAHRTHYYQRLVLLGWGHRRTVLAEYALMLACAGSALLAVRWPPGGQWALIIGWMLIYGLLMWGVGRLERRHATVSTL
jgi:UDP-N-acetylmuramyl pentapeptide phosphotransferase/UDP-N-acetylglucosamine-1-phosphate transferase